MTSFRGFKRSITLEFDYDEVQKGIPNVKRQMAVLNAEFRKSSAEADASGKEINKLGVSYDYLSNKIKMQEKDVEKYRKKLEEATNAEEKSAKAIQNNTANLQIAEAKLAQTKAQLDKVTQELEKQKLTLGKTSEEWNNLSEKTTDIGNNMTKKLTVPILAAAGASFKLGADLEDTMGKAEQVFKRNTKEVEEWSKSAYKNFGLAGVTALSMATDFAAGFNQLGLSLDKAKDYSMNLTSLVTDMSSFYNTTVSETEQALTAILSGQTEPLKKFQIFMTQANLAEFARQKGIRKTIAEMTEAEKVELRYQYVLEKTSQAHGQYAREQGSATTELIKFKQGAIELGTSFSENILPIFTPVISGVNNIIEKFANLSDGAKKFIVTIGGIVAVAGPIILVLGKVFGAIRDISEGMGVAGKAIEGVGKVGKLFSGLLDNTAFMGFAKWAVVIAGVALAIAALVVAINYLIGKGKEMNQFSQNMSDMVSGIGNTVTGAGSSGRAIGRRYIDGSHRDGLDYVPYDGYIAELHRGEKVVTAEENNSSGKGDIYNLYVNMDEVDEVYKLVNVFKMFKQTKRGGLVDS